MIDPQKTIASLRQLLEESCGQSRPPQSDAYAAAKEMLGGLKDYLETQRPLGWGYIGEKLVSLTTHVDAIFGMGEDDGHDSRAHHVWAISDLDTMESNIPRHP